MPAASIAQSLPYVNWTVLFTLAVGCLGFALLAREATDATTGYLRFTAAAGALLGGLALWADTSLPAPVELAIRAAPADLETLRRAGLAAFVALALAFGLVLHDGGRARLVGGGAAVAASAAAVGAAAGWAALPADAVPLLVQIAILSAVTGGALASLALGHWYLVTPRLPTGPLVLMTRFLTGAIAVQLLLFGAWATLGGVTGQQTFDALLGPSALLAWMRLLITLMFPLVLAYMAYRTALTRSMESSTGLLYIGLAAILAGTIGAAALYFSAGLLV